MADIIVLTPQILLNGLRKGSINIQDVIPIISVLFDHFRRMPSCEKRPPLLADHDRILFPDALQTDERPQERYPQ